MKTFILKRLAPLNTNFGNSINHAPAMRGSLFISLLIACFALSPSVQAAPGDGPAVPKVPQVASTGPEIPEGTPTAPLVPVPGFNTADGTNALGSLTTGAANSAFGWFSLFSNADGSFNTAVGAGSLLSNNASGNTAVGAAALLFDTSGSNNTAVGTSALANNTAGFEQTAVGYQALNASTTGGDNTAVGLFAMLNNVGGSSNTAIGTAALRDNVSGINNCVLGRGALRLNEGSGNIAIGREAGATPPSTGQYNNSILIGIPGDANGNNPDGRTYIGGIRGVTVGNADGVSVIIDSDGQLGTSNSSRRFKKDIQPMDQTSEAILALKPVTFHYKDRDTKKAENTPQFGLIAEDVAEVNPDLVVRDSDGKPFTVRYDAVNAMLLNEFLKEHAAVQELKKEIRGLTATVKEQAAQIQKVNARLEVSEAQPLTVVNDR